MTRNAWGSLLGLNSVRTKLSRRSVQAAWVKCTVPATCGWSGDVAIKVLPANLSSDLSLRQRLEREAKAVSRLSHPNICTLHDIGHQDGVDFLVMELVEGETLEHKLIKGPLSPEQAVPVAVQIADALAKAHKMGITHRDLKPSNVMLTKTGGQADGFWLGEGVGPGPAGRRPDGDARPAARLAKCLDTATHRQIYSSASTDTKVSPIPSSNCSGSTLLLRCVLRVQRDPMCATKTALRRGHHDPSSRHTAR